MQIFDKVLVGGYFSSKVKIRGMLSKLLEYVSQKMLCVNNCYEIFIK